MPDVSKWNASKVKNMKYCVTQKAIAEMLELINKGQIDLYPPYQQYFVWTLKDQKQLIDSIILGYPLPNFIISLRKDGTYEMVDGQQRNLKAPEGKVLESKVSDDKIEAVNMLHSYTHNIINLCDTEDSVTVMYWNEIFNSNKVEAYFEKV